MTVTMNKTRTLYGIHWNEVQHYQRYTTLTPWVNVNKSRVLKETLQPKNSMERRKHYDNSTVKNDSNMSGNDTDADDYK
ncbi:hypothetical protein Tco_1192899 [Tanacetum coccineum]